MNKYEKITLEPTAAIALLLGQGIYQDNAHIAQYLKKSTSILASRWQNG